MVDSFFGGGGGGSGGGWGGDDPNRKGGKDNQWDLNTILSMKDVSEKTKAHLTRVYTALLASAGTCTVGMYLNATVMLYGFFMQILFMIGLGYCAYQIRNPSNSENI